MSQGSAVGANFVDVSRRLAVLPPDRQQQFLERLEQNGIDVMRLPIVPLAGRAETPLSFAQQRLWVVDQLQQGSALYNLSGTLVLSGPLDPVILERAVHAVVARHSALRTTFAEIDGQPVQSVGSAAADYEVHDLSEVPLSERRARAETMAAEEATRGFDLRSGPLLRLRLLRLSAEEHHLVLTLHHVVCDEWSNEILIDELFRLYEAFSRGADLPLAPLAIDYADYAVWQRRFWSTGAFSRDLAYWTERLGHEPYSLELPTDEARPAAPSTVGSAHEFLLSTQLMDRLAAIANHNKLTLFTVVFAGFKQLLAKYSGQRQIRVGVPTANRVRPEIEPLVGCFVNTQVLRSEIGEAESFVEFAARLQGTVLAAQAHQALPFERLVDALHAARGTNETPLFNTMFSWHKGDERRSRRVAGLVVSWRPAKAHFAKFDLTLHATETIEGLHCQLLYRSELFRRSTIARMAEHFERLLDDVSRCPTCRFCDLAWTSERERNDAVVAWNATSAAVDERSIHARIRSLVSSNPEAVAVRSDGAAVTYRELERRANGLASRLREMGVRVDDRVALCLPRGQELICALYAVLKCGAAYVPLDAKTPSSRLRQLISDAGAQIVVGRGAPPFDDLPVRFLDLADVEINSDGDIVEVPVAPSNLAYLIYTSGSTGRPKAVAVTHGNLGNYVDGVLSKLRPSAPATFALASTPTADLGNTALFGALCSGGTLVVLTEAESFDVQAFGERMRRDRVDVLKIVPSHFSALLDATESSSIVPGQVLVLGGESSPRSFVAKVRERGACRIVNHYGPTETTVGVLTDEEGSEDEAVGPSLLLGRPLPNSRVYVLDRGMQPAPVGVHGEVYVGGKGVARGYFGRPDLTAERFVPDPFGKPGDRLYRTGDSAKYAADGRVEFLGRHDDQIKLRGHRVELGEVRAGLLRIAGVSDAHVGVRKTPTGLRLIAYVVGQHAPPSEEQLRASLAERLPEHMLPADYVSLPGLPLTPNGKLDRSALPVPESAEPVAGVTEPRSDIEQRLTAVWKDVLKRESVGIHDNFFRIGGDSLLAFQVAAAARDVGIHLTPTQIFDRQTIAELAEVVELSDGAQAASDLAVSGEVEMTPIQRWFFEQDFPNPSHWNQAVLLECASSVRPEALGEALGHLVEHHDALRLRFSFEEGTWCQVYAENVVQDPFTRVDLGAVEDWEQAAGPVIADAQRGLNVTEGPLFRALYLTSSDREPRLLLVAHHLVVDAVSWRILIDDLARCYQAVVTGEAPNLGPKTASFQHWAELLVRHSAGAEIDGEIEHWRTVLAAVRRLPSRDPEAENTVASSEHVTVEFPEELTQQLLGPVVNAQRTSVEEVLLTALTLALCEWTGGSEIVVELEHHGRTGPFEDVDVSRTVGWFTSLYPLLLRAAPGEPSTALRVVKEQLRATPNRGLGFGLLRFLREAFPNASQPSVTFNYLGIVDSSAGDGGVFRLARESTGQHRDPASRRRAELEVIAVVRDGRLHVAWHFSRNLHGVGEIDALASRHRALLTDLCARCLAAGARLVPEDFPMAGLTEVELAEIPVRPERIASIHPLGSMQEGIVFHSLLEPDVGLYVNQKACRLAPSGGLDVELLRQAWQRIAREHDLLRTALAWEQLPHPVQVTVDEIEVPFRVLDWRAVPASRQSRKLQEFLAEDRRRGFALDVAPLLRVSLMRLADDAYQFVLTNHQAILDGWSSSRLVVEVLRVYEDLRAGGPGAPARSTPYWRFLERLARTDAERAEEFWRKRLGGFEVPTLIGGQGRPAAAERGRIRASIDAGCVQRLAELGRGERVTLNTVVQGALAVVLSAKSGLTDVLFGVTTSGREGAIRGIEGMLGLLIHTLPFRFHVVAEMTVGNWLREIQETSVAMREHEHTPLAAMHAYTSVPRDGRLFDTLLVFENYLVDASLQPLLQTLGASDLVSLEATHYPLTVVVSPEAGLDIQLEYLTDQVSAETAQSLLQAIERVLDAFARSSSATIQDALTACLSRLRPARANGAGELVSSVAKAATHEAVQRDAELERRLITIWERTLKRSPIGAHDDFFELGGHSLLAARMMAAVRREIGTEVPLSAAFDAPTIAGLAELLLRAKKRLTADALDAASAELDRLEEES